MLIAYKNPQRDTLQTAGHQGD